MLVFTGKWKDGVTAPAIGDSALISKTLAEIQATGCKAGLAINPNASYETVSEVLPFCDDVMIMTVNPGFAGQ